MNEEKKKQPKHKFISPKHKCVCIAVWPNAYYKQSQYQKKKTFHAGVFLMNTAAAILSFEKLIYCTKIFLFWDTVSALSAFKD